MLKRGSLLGSASLAALLAFGVAGHAQAAARHHHHIAGVDRRADDEAKIDTLTATVSDLENRLNDENQAVQQANAAAQAANAKADQAVADAQAMRGQLEAQIQTVPGEIDTAVDKAKPKPGWWDNTKVGMTIFTDLSYVHETPTNSLPAAAAALGAAIKANGVDADIKRAYLSIDHQFSPVYSANVTFDFAPNGIILNGGTFGTGTLMGSEAIKYAYVQGAYSPMFIVQLGESKTPWIPFVEDIYGYRFVDKVIIDQNKFGNSSDWGANIHGDFGKGLFDYSVSVLDGAGYKNPVRSQSMDVEGRVNVNYHGFVAAIGGYSGDLSNNIQLPQTHPPQAPVFFQTASRVDALVAYVDPRIRAGIEYFEANNWKVTTKTTPDRAEGWSLFGSYVFFPQWSIFGRYDWEEPSEKLDAPERYQLWNVGINYEPVKNLEFALVYKHEDIRNAIKGGYTDGTTTLGAESLATFSPVTGFNPHGSSTGGDWDEVGIYSQIKF
ncbi:MAG TPA: hypothetical protein VKT30_04990 [Caulobacteraceae bacterium]|nr:hypothetical protein [Caulobacteraceae bacterium]